MSFPSFPATFTYPPPGPETLKTRRADARPMVRKLAFCRSSLLATRVDLVEGDAVRLSVQNAWYGLARTVAVGARVWRVRREGLWGQRAELLAEDKPVGRLELTPGLRGSVELADGTRWRWEPESRMRRRWRLVDAEGRVAMRLRLRGGLRMLAEVELEEGVVPAGSEDAALALTWLAASRVLAGPAAVVG